MVGTKKKGFGPSFSFFGIRDYAVSPDCGPARKEYFSPKPGVMTIFLSSLTTSASIPAETAMSMPFFAPAAKIAVAKASLTAPSGSITDTDAHHSPAFTEVGKTMCRKSFFPIFHFLKYVPDDEIEAPESSTVAKTPPSSKGEAMPILCENQGSGPQIARMSPPKLRIASG